MKKLIIAALLAGSATVALADSVIMTETKDWTPVEMTVDDRGVTTVTGTVPKEGKYYYNYKDNNKDFRCLTEKSTSTGMVDPVTHTLADKTTVYCYPTE